MLLKQVELESVREVMKNSYVNYSVGPKVMQDPTINPPSPQQKADCQSDQETSTSKMCKNLRLRNEKNPGCLGYIGNYTTQLYIWGFS